jgi:hypothetical protein
MRTFLTEVLVVLIFIGLHTGISIAKGDQVLVPYALSGLSAVCILVLHLQKALRTPSRSLWYLTVAVFCMAALAGIKNGGFVQPIISAGLFIYSIMIAYATAVGLSVLGLRRARKIFFAAALVLIIGCVLELYGGLKPVSDAFRAAVNTWRAYYNSDLRDQQSYGGLRPNFFASEPSVLGIMAGYSIMFWFISRSKLTGARMLATTFLAGLAFLIIRSPTVLVCLVSALIFFFAETAVNKKIPRFRLVVLGVCSLLAIIFVPPIVAAISSYGQTGSFFLRELVPSMIFVQVIKTDPLFGVGLGGWQNFMSGALTSYSNSGAFARFPYIYNDVMSGQVSGKHLITNQFWELWIDFGLVGGGLVLALVWRTLGRMSVTHRMLVFSAAAMMMTMLGGINTPIGWVGLFSTAVLYRDHLTARYGAKASTADAAALEQTDNELLTGRHLPQSI